MKVSDTLAKDFRKRMKRILAILKKPGSKITSRDFHVLRVEIKRIRSMLALIGFKVKKYKPRKYFKPFSSIFRKAGKVRELQIQNAVLKKYNPDASLNRYFEIQQQKLASERKKFIALLNKNPAKKVKSQTKKILPYFKKVNKRVVKEFFAQKQKQIEEIYTRDDPAGELLHDLRKRIKEMYYLRKLNQPAGNLFGFADEYQELLGEWHDGMVIRDNLEHKILSHKFTPEEIKGLRSLQKKITERTGRLLVLIRAFRNPMA